jgi:uncharacterized protein (TIGR02996 family)
MAKTFRSLFEYLSDDEERPYLIPAMEGKLDDAKRLAYAALLDGRDPARAEWIRLEVALQAQATADKNVHRRFGELGREVGYEFQRIMRRTDVLNCGQGANEPRRVRFAFICEKRWETLHPTENASVRHCNACDSRVFHCSTVREAEIHARAGHCIAVSYDLVDKAAGGGYRNAVGRPDPVGDWSEKLFPED